MQKSIFNLVLFSGSIAAVVAILTYKQKTGSHEFAGILILVASCYLVLYLFLLQFRHEVLHVLRKTFFILIVILVFLLLTKFVADLPGKNLIFLVPLQLFR